MKAFETDKKQKRYNLAFGGKSMKLIKWTLSLIVLGFCVFSLFYVFDRFMFVNYGSIRPVKDASKVYKNIDELSNSCKTKNVSSVLVIHAYENGRAEARCEDQFFAQTWDVSKLIP